MGKLEALEHDVAEVLKKHGLEEFTGMSAPTLATYCVNQLAALKDAHKRTLQEQKEGKKS